MGSALERVAVAVPKSVSLPLPPLAFSKPVIVSRCRSGNVGAGGRVRQDLTGDGTEVDQDPAGCCAGIVGIGPRRRQRRRVRVGAVVPACCRWRYRCQLPPASVTVSAPS